MPSRQEWIDSLFRDYRFLVSSAPKVLKDVEDKQEKRKIEIRRKGKKQIDMKPVFPVNKFVPDSYKIIKPIELLLSIGLITTPLDHNLVDISSTWAVIRYIWAFKPQNSRRHIDNLMLSDEARSIDFHQKSLLSDELGVGFTNFLMENYLNASHPIEANYVIKHPLHYGIRHYGKSGLVKTLV